MMKPRFYYVVLLLLGMALGPVMAQDKKEPTPSQKYKKFLEEYETMPAEEALARILAIYEEALLNVHPNNICQLSHYAQWAGHCLTSLGRNEEAIEFYKKNMAHDLEYTKYLATKNKPYGVKRALWLKMGYVGAYPSSNLQGAYIMTGQMALAQEIHRKERDFLARQEMHKDGVEWENADVTNYPIVAEGRMNNIMLMDNELFYLRIAGHTQRGIKESQWVTDMLKDEPKRSKRRDRDYYRLLNEQALMLDDFGDIESAIKSREEIMSNPVSGHSNVTWYSNVIHLLNLKELLDGPDDKFLEEHAIPAMEKMAGWKEQGSRIHAWLGLAKAYALREDYEKAAEFIQKATEHAENVYRPLGILDARHLSAKISLKRDDLDRLSSQAFEDLLNEYRDLGYKNKEPFIYADYALYLEKTGHYELALKITDEELELLRNFGWTFRIPETLIRKAEFLLQLGDIGSAEAVWNQIHAFQQANSGLPQRIKNQITKAQEKFLKNKVKAEIKEDDTPLRAVTILVQPEEMRTKALHKESVTGRFTFTNIVEDRVDGKIRITSESTPISLTDWNPETGSLTARVGGDGNTKVLEQPVSIKPQERITLYLQATTDTTEQAAIYVQWIESNEKESIGSAWHYSAGGEAQTLSIINSNTETLNPFIPVIFYHEIFYRGETASLENFRVRASLPGRIEIYEDNSRELIAVDANGDGDFEDSGDILSYDADRNMQPDFMVSKDNPFFDLELRFYRETVPEKEIELVVETLEGDKWTEQAVNLIR